MSVTRIQRLLRLITTLQSGSARSTGDLMLELNVSRRTLFRDLKVVHQAGIPYHHQAGRGYRMAPGFFLPPIHLTVPETLGLMLLAKTAAGQPRHPMLAPALGAIHKLVATVPDSIRGACADLMGPVSLGAAPHADGQAQERYYATLLRCIDEGRVCALTYQSPKSARPLECQLEPLGMHFSARSWYVLGRTGAHAKQVRVYKLARVRRLETTERMFAVPRRFRLPLRYRRAWQLNPEGRMHHIELEFSAKVGTNVAEVLWHPSQKHRMLSDGRCVMSFDVDGIREIAWWLCGYAGEVFVRRPLALRQLVAAKHRAAAELVEAPRGPRRGKEQGA